MQPFTPAEIEHAMRVVREGRGHRTLQRELNLSQKRAEYLSAIAAHFASGAPTVAPITPKDPRFRLTLIRALSRPILPQRLAEKMGCSPADIQTALDDLEASGYELTRHGNTVQLISGYKTGGPSITMPTRLNRPAHFGFVTDTHLCNKHQRLDVLEAAYDTFAKAGVGTVFHAGNMVDGESRVNQHELLVHGVGDQIQYVLDHYPARKGITTYYVDGDDHEGWWRQREGVAFGRMLELEAQAGGRTDLRYMGFVENDISLPHGTGRAVIRVMHPGGGSAYALSYTSQKLVESFAGGEKPDILLIGHYHKADYCYIRNVHVVQGGCVCDQTTFMRKNKIAAHVGFWIISLHQDANGAVSRFAPEFHPFFDRGYYEKLKVAI